MLSAKAFYDKKVKRVAKNIAQSGIRSGDDRQDIEDRLYNLKVRSSGFGSLQGTNLKGKGYSIGVKAQEAEKTLQRKARSAAHAAQDEWVRNQKIQSRAKELGKTTSSESKIYENDTLTTRFDQARNAEHGLNKAVNRAKKSIAKRDSRTGASREVTNSKLKTLVNMKRDGKLSGINFSKMGMTDVGNKVKKAETKFDKKLGAHFDASSKEANRDARVMRNRNYKYGS